MLYGYVIIISSVLVLIGYATGRRIGIKEGIKKGRTLSSLSAKIETYEQNFASTNSTNKKSTHKYNRRL